MPEADEESANLWHVKFLAKKVNTLCKLKLADNAFYYNLNVKISSKSDHLEYTFAPTSNVPTLV